MFGKTFFVMPTPWCWGLEGVKKKRMSLCGILSGIGFAAAFAALFIVCWHVRRTPWR